MDDILSRIPHRPPFLWVDRIISIDQQSIITEKDIPEDLDIFAGHYPDNPIMPGVLLCEALFQSGALLMSENKRLQGIHQNSVPVLTRINSAKFKQSVFPGERVRMEVKLKELLSTACFFKGTMKVRGKTALLVDFACALSAKV